MSTGWKKKKGAQGTVCRIEGEGGVGANIIETDFVGRDVLHTFLFSDRSSIVIHVTRNMNVSKISLTSRVLLPSPGH